MGRGKRYDFVLTDVGREFAEKNANLIYRFLHDHKLEEDFYSLIAIGFCRAVAMYNPNKGIFSTFAYKCMHSELSHYFTDKSRQKRTAVVVNYEAIPNRQSNDRFFDGEEFLEDRSDPIGEAILIEDIRAMTTERQKAVLWDKAQGIPRPQTTKRLGISTTTYSNELKKVREYLLG